MTRITVNLTVEELQALSDFAVTQMRPTRLQARYLILQGLGLLPEYKPEPEYKPNKVIPPQK